MRLHAERDQHRWWQRPATRSILLFINFFLIIFAYYLVKPASRSLFLDHADAAHLPYVWTASAALLLALMPLYQRVLRRFGRLNIVIGTCVLIVGLLLLFRVLMQAPGLAIAVGFYILVDIFSVVLVEQFWSLTNSVYRSAEGRRWYGLIASGGLLGGLIGGIAASTLIKSTPLTTPDLLLVAAAIIVLMVAMTLLLARQGLYREHPSLSPAQLATSTGAGLRTLRSNTYLALIALGLLLAQIVEPIVEFQFMTLVEQAYPEREARTAYLSEFLSVLSGFALLVNLLATPLVHRHLGTIAGLMVQPVLLGVSAIAFAFQARLPVAATMKIADRGLSYSINRASRELLYVPVDPATIYRAKAWIDMVGYRTFKIAGNALILLLTQWLPWKLGIAELSWVVVGICAAWVWVVWTTREYYASFNRAAMNLRAMNTPAAGVPE